MKTDAQLQENVVEALQREPEITASEVGVAVSNRAVRLSGVVRTYSEKYAAERAALRVSGVRAVSQEIRVKLAEMDDGSDEEIAEAVSRALQSQADVPTTVQASVEGGWVTLRGEVTSEAQRDGAVDAVWRRAGVERIYNLITIEPARQSAAIKDEMEQAQERNGKIDAECVVV